MSLGTMKKWLLVLGVLLIVQGLSMLIPKINFDGMPIILAVGSIVGGVLILADK